MSSVPVMDEDAVDFVLAAWRDEGRWRVEELPPRAAVSVPRLVESLGAHAGEGGVIGMVSVDEDFFVLVRLLGQNVKLLLSDVGAAVDWPLAAGVIEEFGLTPDSEEADDYSPIGDLEIVADFGMSGDEITMLAEDPDRYPDEVLGAVAARLGFGDQYEALVDNGPT